MARYGRALVGALLAGAVAVTAACSSGHMELSDAKLRQALKRHTIPDAEMVLPFAVDDSVRAFARTIPRQGSALERGRAVARAVRQLLDEGKVRRWRWLRLPATAPRTASALLQALKAHTAGEVYSYEVAALTLATARAAGIHALLAETYRQGGKVADPSGVVGAYAVAIYAKTPAPDVRYVGFVDAFSDGAIDEAKPQDDPTAVAGFYVLASLAHAGGDGNHDAALRGASLAARLAPDSPLPITARGQAMQAAGLPGDALSELREAVHKRDDAPRHVNLANAFLAAREVDMAADGMRVAIERDPTFARAYLSLAVVLAIKSDEKGAAAALASAERLDPNVPGFGLARAHLLAGKGDLAGAEREVRREYEADPGNELAGMMLYGLLRAQGRLADSDLLRDELLKRSQHEGRLRQLFDATSGSGP